MEEITQKQLEANRQNALLGGVKTEEGKAISKYNAIKHGILSKEVLLKGEDESCFNELKECLLKDLKPESAIETLLIDRIVANTWRLKRALKGEKEMIEQDISDIFGAEKNFGIALNHDFANYDSFSKFIRYETSLERGIYRALHELQRIQAYRTGGTAPAPTLLELDITNTGDVI